LLKFGRHFRFGKNKIIVGRNESENKFLMARKAKSEFYFELPDIVGPITILQGAKTKSAIQTAAELTAFHSDAKAEKVKVNFGKESLNKSVEVTVPNRADVDKLRISSNT
jgi:predicted ribosome quality control (RQC) complex YloA/Tae2 family protein